MENILKLSVTDLASDASIINAFCDLVYKDNVEVGWYDTPDAIKEALGDKPELLEAFNVYNEAAMLALIHSEVSEAVEGRRKNLMDDHLPHRPMPEVELADAVIRIFDLCGAKGYDLGGAVVEKILYNRKRADHKREVRAQKGGKVF